jgi:uncharacterized repeat protein (TIGR01451 family)
MQTHIVGRTRRRRRGAAIGITLAIGVGGLIGAGSATASQPHNTKVCHATGSSSNPYQLIEVDDAGAYNGHLNVPGKPDHQSGKDIIPPFTYQGQEYSQNWPSGEQDFNDHCASLTINKTGDPTVEPGQNINYTIVVKNWSKKQVSVTVSDPSAVILNPDATIPAWGTFTWQAVSANPVKPDAASCGTHVKNTATVDFSTLSMTAITSSSMGGGTKPEATDSWTTDVVCPPHVSIAKTATNGPVAPGDTATYDIAVKNTGFVDIPLSDLTVTDVGAGVVIPTVPDPLTPGASAIYKATKLVPTSTPCDIGTVSNTASVAIASAPVDVSVQAAVDPTDTATTPVVCPVDFTIAKSGNAIVQPNGQISYQIVVTNTGKFPVPFGAILVDDPSAPPVTPPVDPPTVLDPGASLTWTATSTAVIDGNPCNASIVNTASVALDKVPGYVWPTGPQQSQFTTQVVCPVDVTVAKTTPSTTVVPGGTVPYSITVTNPSAFPVPFSAIAVTDDGATITPPVDTTDLAPGAERVWTATKVAGGTAACGTTVSNTAQVTLVGLPEGYSPVTPGGSSSAAPGVTIAGGDCPVVTAGATTPDAAVAIAALPQLLVRKSGPAIARKGSAVTYKIKVTNRGPRAASNVVITDTPPRSMLIGGTPQGATRSGRTLTWALGDMAVGASRTVTVTLGMRLTASGTPCNTATATSSSAATARGKACTRIQAVRDPRVTG